ncbi:hypothetical protein AR703_002597 [Salmonella enterica subsp. enterica serovar Cerro]|uniref:Uncharacterized protein n=2 Tax=Salmonella enterica TaxID=28901 RepID=A0A5T2RWB9_SALER|nr:hypothetical protein [Salmonella enterica subsp. enterica serovar Cerro]EAM5810435.1 hypothetical protein [Salmonella enterica]EBP3476532.1 hypothetical protein [Salmonella enterica subsp. enterica]ECW7086483.1 hypothetical protein [Salmonella enterica subsp. enterica serovar Derby]EAN9774148.1 hypothetical protein [Salmonella enterica]
MTECLFLGPHQEYYYVFSFFSAICYLLSAICYLLSAICYLLSAICYLLVLMRRFGKSNTLALSNIKLSDSIIIIE